jgi:hypothetical protein
MQTSLMCDKRDVDGLHKSTPYVRDVIPLIMRSFKRCLLMSRAVAVRKNFDKGKSV